MQRSHKPSCHTDHCNEIIVPCINAEHGVSYKVIYIIANIIHLVKPMYCFIVNLHITILSSQASSFSFWIFVIARTRNKRSEHRSMQVSMGTQTYPADKGLLIKVMPKPCHWIFSMGTKTFVTVCGNLFLQF